MGAPFAAYDVDRLVPGGVFPQNLEKYAMMNAKSDQRDEAASDLALLSRSVQQYQNRKKITIYSPTFTCFFLSTEQIDY